MTKLDHGRNLTGKELAELIGEFVNAGDKKEYAEFVDAIVNREHRTLQQKICSLFMNTFEAWGSLPADRYDLRNQATVKLAKTVVEATKDVFYKSLPLI